MTASVVSCQESAATSGAASVSLTGVSPGDLIVIYAITTTSGSPYPSSITDTFGSSLQTAMIGSFGSYSSMYVGTAATIAVGLFYGYATGTGSDTVSVAFSSAHSGQFILVTDITGVASGNAITSNIVNWNPATSSFTVAGGSGSDTVSTAPALLVAMAISQGGSAVNWTPASGWTKNSPAGNQVFLVESDVVTSTGTVDATATTSSNTSAYLWQIVVVSLPIIGQLVM